nr:hypothetical protein GCM10020241_02850 [Streptoalloteichus tenebrarius]
MTSAAGTAFRATSSVQEVSESSWRPDNVFERTRNCAWASSTSRREANIATIRDELARIEASRHASGLNPRRTALTARAARGSGAGWAGHSLLNIMYIIGTSVTCGDRG